MKLPEVDSLQTGTLRIARYSRSYLRNNVKLSTEEVADLSIKLDLALLRGEKNLPVGVDLLKKLLGIAKTSPEAIWKSREES